MATREDRETRLVGLVVAVKEEKVPTATTATMTRVVQKRRGNQSSSVRQARMIDTMIARCYRACLLAVLGTDIGEAIGEPMTTRRLHVPVAVENDMGVDRTADMALPVVAEDATMVEPIHGVRIVAVKGVAADVDQCPLVATGAIRAAGAEVVDVAEKAAAARARKTRYRCASSL